MFDIPWYKTTIYLIKHVVCVMVCIVDGKGSFPSNLPVWQRKSYDERRTRVLITTLRLDASRRSVIVLLVVELNSTKKIGAFKTYSLAVGTEPVQRAQTTWRTRPFQKKGVWHSWLETRIWILLQRYHYLHGTVFGTLFQGITPLMMMEKGKSCHVQILRISQLETRMEI